MSFSKPRVAVPTALAFVAILLLLSACVESNTSTQVVVPTLVDENPPTGELALALINGPSNQSFSSFWRCLDDGQGEFIDLVFGQDGTGIFRIAGEDQVLLKWGIVASTQEVIFFIEDSPAALWFSDVTFLSNAEFFGNLFINMENLGQANCVRYDLNNSTG
ncbi:MAG: hypothetical protein KTR35_04970 [Gammaproteobacteria bacterium]|nr:hypothetical protein [Gammaproteobacteria bacterium]